MDHNVLDNMPPSVLHREYVFWNVIAGIAFKLKDLIILFNSTVLELAVSQKTNQSKSRIHNCWILYIKIVSSGHDLQLVICCRDTLIKPITVEAEGFPREKTWTKYICTRGKYHCEYWPPWGREGKLFYIISCFQSKYLGPLWLFYDQYKLHLG